MPKIGSPSLEQLTICRLRPHSPQPLLEDRHVSEVRDMKTLGAGARPVSLNMSIDADPPQQAAASPLVLAGRSFLR